MKRLLTTFVLPILVAASGLQAQKGCVIKLRAASDIVKSNSAEVILTIDVQKKTTVPAALLSGIALKTTVDGKPGPKIMERASGKVSLTAGTKIERAIQLDLTRVAPNIKKDGMTRIGLEWVGIPSASAVLEVAPDLSKVKVDELDLVHTKVILVTNYGEMIVKFFPDKAPNTVRNFVKLAKEGFYDGTQFHRIIAGFMIQGGCPNTKKGAMGRPGTGDPGYKIKAEFNDTRHVKGVLSMARGGDPDSAGCQFFVVHAPSPHLDNKYTAFGELVTGQGTLDKIASVSVGGPQRSTPDKPVHLKAAIVQPAFKQKK